VVVCGPARIPGVPPAVVSLVNVFIQVQAKLREQGCRNLEEPKLILP